MALQAENYALEKQLHSYQQSIAKTNAKGLLPECDTNDSPSSPTNSIDWRQSPSHHGHR